MGSEMCIRDRYSPSQFESRKYETSDATTDDKLYGEGGDDILIGNSGSNILDGGQGSDRLIGGEGNDVFIIEASNSGIDIIEDFEDNMDSIGLAGALSFNDLDITQSGSDTLISLKETGQDIVMLAGISSDLITLGDFFSANPDPQILAGDDSDNVLIGGIAGDTISTGSGNDTVSAALGDDIIIVDGSGDKDISGGIGTDTLQLSLAGVTGITDLVSIDYPITYWESNGYSSANLATSNFMNAHSGGPWIIAGYMNVTTGDGSVIKVTSIENLVIGDETYSLVQPRPLAPEADIVNNAFVNAEDNIIYMMDAASFTCLL